MSEGIEDRQGAGSETAVIGYAGRFPGAPDVERFWRNLRDGTESLQVFERSEDRDPSRSPAGPPIDAGGVLEEIDQFDAEFFGFSCCPSS